AEQVPAEAAAGQAGHDQQDVDVKAGELAAEGFGQAAEGELAGRVLAPGGHAAAAAHGGHVDDGRLPPPRQGGDGKAGQLGRGEEVHLHHLAQDRLRAVREVAPAADAGVVDQDVETVEALHDSVEQVAAFAIGRDIGGDRNDIR